MRNAIFRSLVLTLLLSLFWRCDLGVNPILKPDYSGTIGLAMGDTVLVNLTPVLAVTDTILGYAITEPGDTSIVTIMSLGSDSIQFIGNNNGMSQLAILALGSNNRYTVELLVIVAPQYAQDNLNSVNLGDTLKVDLARHGIVDPASLDSIFVSFQPANLARLAGFTQGKLELVGAYPGTGQMHVTTWRNSQSAELMLSLNVFIRRTALAELFTNSGCNPCVSANQKLDEIAASAQSENLAIIRYHTSWPSPNDPMYHYNEVENSQRRAYYDVTQAPTLVIDGALSASTNSLWSAQIQQDIDHRALLTLKSLAITYAGTDSITVRLAIRAYTDLTDQPLTLTLVVAEDSLEYLGENGESLHQQVMRDLELVPLDAFAQDSIITKTSRLKWRAGSENKSRYKIVAFIQNASSKEVLQTSQFSLH